MKRASTKVLVLLHFVGYCLLLLAMKAVPGGPFVLVVSDPRASAAQVMHVIGAAGGEFVEATRFPWISVAYSRSGDFPAQLRQAGALIVVGYPSSAGCLQRSI